MEIYNGIQIHENEVVDDLQTSGFKIIQSNNHFKFSIDAVLLSHYPNIKQSDSVLDLCSGTGVVGLLICANTNAKQIDLIEVQEYLCNMSSRTIMLNNVEDRMKCYNLDINELPNKFKLEQYNVIICNPPYLKMGQGQSSLSYTKRISRFEELLKLDDIFSVSFKMLKNRGKLALIHRAERMAEVLSSMRDHNIEPKRLRLIHSKMGSNAVLFLVEGVKNGNENMIVEEPLIIYKEDNTYTEEIYKIYNIGS